VTIKKLVQRAEVPEEITDYDPENRDNASLHKRKYRYEEVLNMDTSSQRAKRFHEAKTAAKITVWRRRGMRMICQGHQELRSFDLISFLVLKNQNTTKGKGSTR